ncbi:AraC family transcriptional regulator [Leptospira wolffii]|uniref:helix-turn-helix domain-containing protein n=1 Tax=Leptospira wolffii TaxID=409998 RepID=UPI001083476D|nr:AraC family transcriptional regulator [Leptospira wolffii]TGK64781.1 AraC family transcriptional regulator [Leptospira wolffii]TGK76820.1 AraC family transcriptional regulator [Leptospira wolffii]TGK77328.1 AraC family transcriptional regulator [Leptospira wolffii]TGL26723.1 AraC family transcriptional regulator [Leptospira wolffii]
MAENRNGTLFYFGGRVLLAHKGLSTDPHSHYAVSILISLSSPLKIVDEFGITREFKAAVLAPNTHHTLLAEECDLIVLQLDPYGSDYAPIAARFGRKGIHEIPFTDLESTLERCNLLFTENLSCSDARELFEDILTAVGSEKPAKVSLDPRILSATKKMQESLPGSVSVPELAKESGFSETRFMHVFKIQMGLPVRQFQLWLRLHEAAKLLKEGGNLTEASHAAGFADQAHLSRTFKRMFGVQPSRFLGANTNVTVHFCV